MPTYTTDEDLVPVYVANSGLLPDSLVRLHEAAYAQIRRDLVAAGRTTAELDALTADSLEALKVPSCHYVLYLHYQGQTHDRSGELLERAKHHLGEYQRTLRTAPIVSTVVGTSAPSPFRRGYVVLG